MNILKPRKDHIGIFDGHNDTVHKIREYLGPEGIDFLVGNPSGHLDLPRAKRGGMVGGFFAIYVPAEHPSDDHDDLTTTETSYCVRMANPLDPTYARRSISRQLAALKSLAARSEGAVRMATTVEAIEDARNDGAFAMLVHMEGAEAIGAGLTELDDLYSQGLRSLGPVWSRPNIFGHGVPFAFPSSPDTGPGLTSPGKELIRACNRLGVMIDLSHLNERGFWDVAAITTVPLVATHTCVHAICPSARNLTDKQLDAIRETDGIVGLEPLRQRSPPRREPQRRHLARRRGAALRLSRGPDWHRPRGAGLGLRRCDHPLGHRRRQRIAAPHRRSPRPRIRPRISQETGFENWMRVLRLTLGPERIGRVRV